MPKVKRVLADVERTLKKTDKELAKVIAANKELKRVVNKIFKRKSNYA